jgi:hypothetical protein
MDRPRIPEPVDPAKAQVVIIDGDAYREQRRAVRRYLAAIVAAVVIAMSSVVWTQMAVLGRQDDAATRGRESLRIARNVERTVDILESATSPEAQAASAEQIRATIAAIGCDNRAALQDLLDQLIARGILTPGDATIDCTDPTNVPALPSVPLEPAIGTTTTSEVPR